MDGSPKKKKAIMRRQEEAEEESKQCKSRKEEESAGALKNMPQDSGVWPDAEVAQRAHKETRGQAEQKRLEHIQKQLHELKVRTSWRWSLGLGSYACDEAHEGRWSRGPGEHSSHCGWKESHVHHPGQGIGLQVDPILPLGVLVEKLGCC